MAIESIVHVITDAGPHPYFRTLIEADWRPRERLCVGSLGPAGALQEDMASLGVDTFALGARSRAGYPAAVARLVRILRSRQAEIVQTHLLDGCLAGLLAARAARSPVAVMTAHHSHELPFHGARLRLVDRLCAGPLSDHVIAPSRSVATTLEHLAGTRAEKIAVVHHGFDLERLSPDRVSGATLRAELGLDGALVFGSIGRLYWLKGQESLVEAFAAALADVPEARLLLVGPGDPAPIAGLARRLGIGDRVIIAGPRSDVPEALAAMDAFVHPALAESFGMVIVEAMVMGRPVLSTPVGIAPEVLQTGVTGVLARGTGVEALANALRELLALQGRWAELGAAARARVGGFKAQRMAERYEHLYEEWLGQTRH